MKGKREVLPISVENSEDWIWHPMYEIGSQKQRSVLIAIFSFYVFFILGLQLFSHFSLHFPETYRDSSNDPTLQMYREIFCECLSKTKILSI